jgi:1,4-dihydroxy-2-naphthoate octaprenyltransferase
MEICFLAKVVLLLSIIGISTDIYLFGFSFTTLLMNILFTVLVVWITNSFCFTQSYNWIAWIIVIITFLMLIVTLFIVKHQNDEEIKQIIEEEKKTRK